MTGSIDYGYLDTLGAASIFFPRADHRLAPKGALDILIEVSRGGKVGARFYVNETQAPTIFYFHGNGEVAADHDDIAPLYHRIGVNLFVVEFRGYGQSEGTPTFADLVTDALPCARYFHDYMDAAGFSSRRFLMGRSLGSHPALELAANASARFSGLIIESGAADLGRLLERLGADGLSAGELLVAAHEDKLRSINLPTLIIHGEQDELVEPTQAATLGKLLGESTLLLISGAGHNDLLWVDATSYFAAIRQLIFVDTT